MCDGKRGAITDSNCLRRGGCKGLKITRIGCHMGGCAGVHVPFVVGEVHVVQGGDERRVELVLLVLLLDVQRRWRLR